MTTRFKTSLAAALAVVTMATAAPMLMAARIKPAAPAGAGPWRTASGCGRAGRACAARRADGFGPGFRELDLTDDQKAQLQDDRRIASRRSSRRPAKRSAPRARACGRSSRRDTINESAIRAKSAEIAAAEADMMILNAKVRAGIDADADVGAAGQAEGAAELSGSAQARSSGSRRGLGTWGLGS